MTDDRAKAARRAAAEFLRCKEDEHTIIGIVPKELTALLLRTAVEAEAPLLARIAELEALPPRRIEADAVEAGEGEDMTPFAPDKSCGPLRRCEGMRSALEGVPENHGGKGLSVMRGWVEESPGAHSRFRIIGVSYNRKARDRRDWVLNFCPWCGASLRADVGAAKGTVTRRKCPMRCPCICHDTGGSGHGHEGRPCPGKTDAAKGKTEAGR